MVPSVPLSAGPMLVGAGTWVASDETTGAPEFGTEDFVVAHVLCCSSSVSCRETGHIAVLESLTSSRRPLLRSSWCRSADSWPTRLGTRIESSWSRGLASSGACGAHEPQVKNNTILVIRQAHRRPRASEAHKTKFLRNAGAATDIRFDGSQARLAQGDCNFSLSAPVS